MTQEDKQQTNRKIGLSDCCNAILKQFDEELVCSNCGNKLSLPSPLPVEGVNEAVIESVEMLRQNSAGYGFTSDESIERFEKEFVYTMIERILTSQRQLLEKKVMDIKPSLSGNVELIRKDIVLSLLQSSLEDKE